MDKSAANKAGIDKINQGLTLNKINARQINYQNNRIEQDHRFVNKIIELEKVRVSGFDRSANFDDGKQIWMEKFIN